ncbi:Nucleoside diphosphate kinase, partial [Globisporangium splendens]
MEEEQHLSFFLEWYDPQSDQRKPYVLHYHSDNTIELTERYNKRVFLKRIRIPTVTLDDLVPGGSVTVYSRQLTVLDAANEHTRQLLKKKAAKALFVIRPKGYAHMGVVIKILEQSGLVLLNAVMVQLRQHHMNALRPHCLQTSASTPRNAGDDAEFLRDVSVLVEVKLPMPNILEDALGKLDAARLMANVLVCESIGLDIFNSPHPGSSMSSKQPMPSRFPTTAVFDNCTLCILKPRMIREGHVGDIVDTIVKAGYEISALTLLHLQMNDADEFFRVYKGVLRQYHEVLKYMCSGPCVALEIRGEDVVRRFRDFCGPFDVQIAQALRPASLRAKFGKSSLFNAVHCTDCPEDGVLESQFIFHALTSNKMESFMDTV